MKELEKEGSVVWFFELDIDLPNLMSSIRPKLGKELYTARRS